MAGRVLCTWRHGRLRQRGDRPRLLADPRRGCQGAQALRGAGVPPPPRARRFAARRTGADGHRGCHAVRRGGSADALLQGQACKDRLRRATEAAAAAGVWGAPAFAADGEVFWGVDRLPMLDNGPERGGW
ncbi:DsbA family protein [Pseudorhodoferax sp. Leaf265]|uniref:DsbA family protein n=1 Tax=Pseudorhodoferax sp. Leaf265 TaxID=1736315 RepID=UPI0009EA70AA